MLASVKPRLHRSYAELDSLATKYAPVILGGLLGITSFQKLSLILHTDGGGDLLGADIPKSMMLIAGQNPYSSNPWASPYPPFLLAMVGSIIRVTSGSTLLTPETLGLISRNVRLAGVLADAIVALLVFLTLRVRGFSGLSALVPSAVFLALPSIGISPYYWFNSDVLGYPILAGSVLALVQGRYFVGSVLLAIGTIFKIHPILAIPLLFVWLVRKRGTLKSLPILVTTGSILLLGLVVPAVLPGSLGLAGAPLSVLRSLSGLGCDCISDARSAARTPPRWRASRVCPLYVLLLVRSPAGPLSGYDDSIRFLRDQYRLSLRPPYCSRF